MPPVSLHSWNVNGLRSVAAKSLGAYLDRFAPDILCLQETKIGADLADSLDLLAPYPHRIWHSADRPGYSGCALLSKIAPRSVLRDFPEDDTREGRVLAVEFPGVRVVCAYVPNSRRELTRLDHRLAWDGAFRRHLAGLAAEKPLLLCGDFNCAHTEADLANPKTNRRNAGFTDEERASFSSLLHAGYDDTFRTENPTARGAYTWWSHRPGIRQRNIGWRLDYWLADHRLSGRWSAPAIHADVPGSDHCPVSLALDPALFR